MVLGDLTLSDLLPQGTRRVPGRIVTNHLGVDGVLAHKGRGGLGPPLTMEWLCTALAAKLSVASVSPQDLQLFAQTLQDWVTLTDTSDVCNPSHSRVASDNAGVAAAEPAPSPSPAAPGLAVQDEDEEVGRMTAWLERLGLSEYATRLVEQEITLDVLSDMTDERLDKLDMPMGPRKKILKAIGVGVESTERLSDDPFLTRWLRKCKGEDHALLVLSHVSSARSPGHQGLRWEAPSCSVVVPWRWIDVAAACDRDAKEVNAGSVKTLMAKFTDTLNAPPGPVECVHVCNWSKRARGAQRDK
mmetsp:Transcript_51246/g.111442  ORF Transcript_51246/g.111442 Transcript_51246/m.111442 type:complete len:301 (-) Transcript_51246:62-964(-)